MYSKNYYVSYKTPFVSDDYQHVIKLSHKIQNSDDDIDSKFTAIADFDFNQINKKVFYSDLINTTKETPLGKLTFFHQNINNFLLEKIYYIGLNIEQMQKNNLYKNTKLNNHKSINEITNEITDNNNKIQLYDKYINKLNDKNNNNTLQINNNNYLLDKYNNELINLKQKIDQSTNHNNKIFQQLTNKFTETYKKYELLIDENKKNLDNKNVMNEHINNYIHEIKNLNNLNDLNKKKLTAIENEKILLNKIKNTQRFINKFSCQVKFAVKIITYNPSDSEDTLLTNQIEYIKKLIFNNLEILEINTSQASNIITTIYPQ